MPNLQSKLKGRGLITALERVVWATALCFLAWISLSGSQTRSELRLATSRAIRVAELRGTLSYLDEWLTMSARMAAATGDERWVERYNEASPKLAATVEEALTVATPEVAAALVTTTEEAWNGLHQMQLAAFKMAVTDRAGALKLLESNDYDYLQQVYQSGIDNFGRDLMALSEARSASLNKRAWLEAAGLFLGAMFFVASLLTKRSKLRLFTALADTEKVARTDPLTGLPNRRKLFEDLQGLTSAGAPGQSRLAFLILDLDRFKAVNDAHGHPVGDDLLKLVASRLQATVRADDLVARLGGDEFAIIASIDETRAELQTNVIADLAERIVKAFESPFKSRSGIMLQVNTSIGIAVYDPDILSIEDLTYRADAALYRAKNGGRNRVCFFDPNIDKHVREDARLETSLRHAIENGALVPYFQPLFELHTRRLVAFEMLARWPQPDGSMVSPAEFIPIAEKSNLIAPLTECLMRSAFKIAAAWPIDITLACNVSPLLLRDHTFIDMLRKLLTETGFTANKLELEITESALLDDLTVARKLLRELKSLGVSLALDDFGTGFSSLRHLHTLPLDKLKIDAGFVTIMHEDADSRMIVEAVIGLGRNLGIMTVAEGVETEYTAALLRLMGCDLGQGWLFGRPCNPAAAKAHIDQFECVSNDSKNIPVRA